MRLEACRDLAGEAWEEGKQVPEILGWPSLCSVQFNFEPGVSWDELWVTAEELLNVPSAACGFGRAAPSPSLGEGDWKLLLLVCLNPGSVQDSPFPREVWNCIPCGCRL